MKLIYIGYNLEMELHENQVIVLSIENAKLYSEFLQNMWNQTQGKEGKWVLLDKEKKLKLSREMECIFNPFSLNCNDRKILTKLYQEIKQQSDIFLQEEFMLLNANINQFLDRLLLQMPYALKYNSAFQLPDLLKIFSVEIECDEETLLGQIVEYLWVMKKICGVNNYVFVGLKQYLPISELERLYEYVFYEKINLIIIESIYTPLINGEKGWIIDKDLCIIDL